MNQTKAGGQVLRVAGSVLISFILQLTAFGSLFFTLPLLLLDRRYPKRTTDTACVAALVLVLGRNILLVRDVLNQSLTWGFIGVSMFMPLSLILGAMVWVGKSDEESLFRRCLLSSLPSVVLFALAEAALLAMPEIREGLVEAYGGTISAMMSLFVALDASTLALVSQVVLLALSSLVVPMVVVNNLVVIYIYEASVHQADTVFEERVRGFRIPEWFLYLFLALWAGVLAAAFITMPLPVVLPLLALAISSLFAYFMQGFAIVCWKMHERGMRASAFKVAAWLLLILVIVQVVNALLVLGIAILGVLENWINFRKPKEFSNEDHS